MKSGRHRNEGAPFLGQSEKRPLSTVTDINNHPLVLDALISAGGRSGPDLQTAHLLHFYGQKTLTEVRGQTLTTPVKTQTTENRHALSVASLVQHFGGFSQSSGFSPRSPLNSVTATDHHALLSAHLVKYYGASHAQSARAPVGALTTRARYSLVLATLVRPFGTSNAASIWAPLGTVVAQGGGKTHLLTAKVDLLPGGRARAVYELMNRFAPECLTARDHEFQVVFVNVGDVEYIIADVSLRMLIPRELARAQSFPDSYVLEYTADGEEVTLTDQVKGIGNSVPPIMAQVLCQANLPLYPAQAAD